MNQKHKCVFLDRDGVVNVERGDYTFRVNDFVLEEGVPEAVKLLKEAGYLIIVITNQAGISRNLYTREQMEGCHRKMHEETQHIIEEVFYCPYHPSVSQSIARKPDTVMLERAIAKYNIDPGNSWLVGDRERDIEAAQLMDLKTIRVDDPDNTTNADHNTHNLLDATKNVILNSKH